MRGGLKTRPLLLYLMPIYSWMWLSPVDTRSVLREYRLHRKDQAR